MPESTVCVDHGHRRRLPLDLQLRLSLHVPVEDMTEVVRGQPRTMAENAPAHIGFHTFYPPYNDMVQFEEVYFKWLELLPNKHNESSYADTSFELITLLKHYHETYCHD